MRTLIFAVAAIVAASWAIDQAPAADRIPAFDIAGNCSAEVANVGIEKVADCTKDETDAKNELDKAGLNLARRTSRPASGRAALEARRAMWSF